MEWFIRHGGSQNIPLYNCSARTAEEWTARDGEKHFEWGLLSMTYGVIIELLYIPCLIVIRSKECYSHSCFKIMFFLGLVDMAAIMVNSVITGYLLMHGSVFCSYPDFLYITGSCALGCWCMACMICLILVINRLLDISRMKLARYNVVDVLFSNTGTYTILLIAFLYGLYATLFTPPVAFQSKYGAWFFDPFIFPNRSSEYQNPLHTANNIFIVGFTCVLYGIFCVALGNRFREALSDTNAHRKIHNQIFLQSTVICMVNFIASIVYVVMNFFPVPQLVIVFGHIGWQAGHGCPAIIYLAMNKTIRNGVLRLIHLKKSALSNNLTNHNTSSNKTQQISPSENYKTVNPEA